MLVPDLEHFSSVMTAEMVLFSFPFVFNVNVEISEPDTILIILIRSFSDVDSNKLRFILCSEYILQVFIIDLIKLFVTASLQTVFKCQQHVTAFKHAWVWVAVFFSFFLTKLIPFLVLLVRFRY